MTPARPMLAEVLAALTGLPLAFWRADDPARVVVTEADVSLRAVPGERGWAVGPILWAYPDPAEAWEVLGTRGIVPMGYAGRFVCGCSECRGAAHERPTSLPDLVAWASLGFAASDDGTPGILGAEELGATYGHPMAWEIREPVRGIGSAYRSGSVGDRLLDAGVATWLSNDYLTLCVPPLTPA